MVRKTVLRVAQQIHAKVAHILLHEVKDPRLGFVTVTRTSLNDDLSECYVYYSVMGTETQRRLTVKALDSSHGYVQKRVAETLTTRTMPTLRFAYDEAVEGVERMGDLLRTLREERAEAPPTDEPNSRS